MPLLFFLDNGHAISCDLYQALQPTSLGLLVQIGKLKERLYQYNCLPRETWFVLYELGDKIMY